MTDVLLVWEQCHAMINHYDDVTVSGLASQITSLTIVYSTILRVQIKENITGLCVGNSPGTGEFPAQMASNAETVSIWWRHYALNISLMWTLWSSNLRYHEILTNFNMA